MKELKYTEPLTESVNKYKAAVADMLKVKPEAIKLVGIHLCFAQENGDFTTTAKMWATKEAADLFVEDDYDESPNTYDGHGII